MLRGTIALSLSRFSRTPGDAKSQFDPAFGKKISLAMRHVLRASLALLVLSQININSPANAQTAAGEPTLDANGWTAFTPSIDTKVIYVSSSTGNDSNDGLSQNTPVKTIRYASSLLRTGFPDWLLLKKGDSWTLTPSGDQFNTSGYPGSFCKSGRSATEPMLISSYGTGARPLLLTDLPQGTTQYAAFGQPFFSGWCAADYFAVAGLEFYQYKHDPANPSYDPTTAPGIAISLGEPSNWWLIENCKFSYYGVAINVGGGASNLAGITHKNAIIRRNVSAYSYANSTGGFATAYHIENVGTLLAEENTSYHDGWSEIVPGGARTTFNHGFYIQGNTDPTIMTVTGNILISASWAGIQQRPGGLTTGNFLEKNGVGITSGNSAATIDKNVVLQSMGWNGSNNGINPGSGGWGIHIYLSGNPMTATGNIVAHGLTTTDSEGLAFDGYFNSYGGSGLNNIVFDWPTPFYDSGIGTQLTGNVFAATNSNTYSYPAPSRDAETYDAEILGGPGTMAHFASLLLAQSKDNWNVALTANALNNYVRAGFGLSAVPYNFAMPTFTTTSTGTSPTSTTSTGSTSTTSTGTTSTGTTSTGSTSTTSTGTPSTGTSSTSTTGTGTSSNPPAVAISAPANATIVKGNGAVNIAVSASDTSVIRSIAILLDGNVYQTCVGITSCSSTLQGKKVSQGTHVISATAVDAAGLVGSTSVSITALK